MPVARHLLFTPGVSQKGAEASAEERLEIFPQSSENDFVIFPSRCYIAFSHKVMRWEPQSYLRYVGNYPGVLRRPGHLLELNPREVLQWIPSYWNLIQGNWHTPSFEYPEKR